jgi:uracil-DNA glycosylase
MASQDNMVYLEDVEPTPAERKREAAEKKALQDALKGVTPAAPSKRQISLTDMGIPAPNKRPKTEKTEKADSTTKGTVTQKSTVSTTRAFSQRSSSGSASQPTVNGLPKLNAIPYSQSAYQESLTEDERRLLALELAVMGKSW